ncbi:Stealth CR1 domain-containing protein [bacterium]|nr:Stealth CR1 domain-containing protein [bacterium]
MDIDLVYLWVDDTDWDWKKKRNKYLQTFSDYDDDAVDKCRFYNNNELMYSLRSVERYAPWIHKIFIVTDNQIPDWLNTENEKIRIVDHTEIIPKEYLPLFNSCAIETRLPYIPNLSEYFLYANDDMFFWKPVTKDFFFIDGKMICRMREKIKKHKIYRHVYGHTVNRACNMIKERFGCSIPYFMHHSIDAYTKSAYFQCMSEFKKDYDITLNNRFRDYSDIQRSLISYYAITKNLGIFKQVKQNFIEKFILKQTEDSHYFNIKTNILTKINNINTYLMCLNDCRKTRDEDRDAIRQILEEKFPHKSQFEK